MLYLVSVRSPEGSSSGWVWCLGGINICIYIYLYQFQHPRLYQSSIPKPSSVFLTRPASMLTTLYHRSNRFPAQNLIHTLILSSSLVREQHHRPLETTGIHLPIKHLSESRGMCRRRFRSYYHQVSLRLSKYDLESQVASWVGR